MARARHRIPRLTIAPETGVGWRGRTFAGVHIKSGGKSHCLSCRTACPDVQPSLHLVRTCSSCFWSSVQLLYQVLCAQCFVEAYLKQHAPHPSLHCLDSHAAYRFSAQEAASAALPPPYAGSRQRVDAALDALTLLSFLDGAFRPRPLATGRSKARNNGRRRAAHRIPVAAAESMGPEPAHLSALPSWHARTGVLWLQFRYTAVTNGIRWIQCDHPSTTDASTAAATDYAAMAIDVEQSITCNVPTPLPATGAAHSTNVDRTIDDTDICNLWTIDINAAKDVD